MKKPEAVLYIVATPIGNLEDMSERALRILREVDLIAAEDTRHSKKLLQHYGINTTLISLHEHNEQVRSNKLLEQLQQGKNIALISDAGTPLISDPGFHLVAAVRAANIPVVPIPGPCAAIAALSAAGLPSDRFLFEGFLPAKSPQRQQRLIELQFEPHTVIFYEAPHRILATINDMITIYGSDRSAVLAKELTKTFETIYGGKLIDLKTWLEQDENHRRGEFVILVHGNPIAQPKALNLDPLKILDIFLAELPLKQAVDLTVKITGEKKNALYQIALEKTKTKS